MMGIEDATFGIITMAHGGEHVVQKRVVKNNGDEPPVARQTFEKMAFRVVIMMVNGDDH